MKEPSQRVKDLLAGMTVAEKALQLSCVVPSALARNGIVQETRMSELIPDGVGRLTQFATGFFKGPKQAAEGHNAIQQYVVDRTGVPSIIQNESANGLVAEGATVFPVPIALASTWRPELARRMGEVISREGRAIGVKVAMSPVVDITRDARWGRVGEMLGEDPLLASRFAVEETRGIQGDDYRQHLIACAKHFMGYSASETGINTAVINMGRKDLFEVWGTPFAAAIAEADLQTVMVTYSEINGLPMSVNEYYLRQVLRADMGFTGVAICDGGSIPRSMDVQGLYTSKAQLAGRALRAGLDADTPFTSIYDHIPEAVEQGLVDPADLDEAVLRILTHKEEMGLFDDPYVDADAATAEFARPESLAVSAEIARDELTLLKNNGALPLAPGAKVFLTGPFADRLSTLFGGYAYPSFVSMIMTVVMGNLPAMEGIGEYLDKMFDRTSLLEDLQVDLDASYTDNLDAYIRRSYDGIQTVREALVAELGETRLVHVTATGNGERWEDEIAAAVDATREVDIIIATLGEITGFGEDATSGEGVNNPDLSLPGHQAELVKQLAATGKPVVLVLFNGRPLILSEIEPHCAAIVEAWYPGPAGASAVVDALTGKTNPGGKLPVTFPRSSEQCPVYYGHKAGSGYWTIKDTPDASVLQPLYPFGHGLSYTTFEIDNLEVPGEITIGDTFTLTVDVTNTGPTAGDEVVQVYSRTTTPSVVRPVKELRGFARVTLQPSETRTVTFTLDTHQFGYYDADDEFVIEPSGLRFMAGTSSADIRQQASSALVGPRREILHTRAFGFGVA